MKDRKRRVREFGKDEYGFSMLPVKYSNTKISRIDNTDKTGGCSFCFPHGIESTNSTWSNFQRSWKCFRKHQYIITRLEWNFFRRKIGYRRNRFQLTNDNIYNVLEDYGFKQENKAKEFKT